MKRIFYLTRTWTTSTGGGLMRKRQVELLRENGFELIVFCPNYDDNCIVEKKDIIKIPYKFSKIYSLAQRFGLKEDYLDPWVKDSFTYLKNIVKKDDLLFATTGGELGCIKLGSLLKEYCRCKYLINYSDPISYAPINGLNIDNKFHIDRSRYEYKYIKSADLIISSSIFLKENLLKKYNLNHNKIFNNYFGYINKVSFFDKKESDILNISYMGAMSKLQSPEILSKSALLIPYTSNFSLEYIGACSLYKNFSIYKNFYTKFTESLKYEELIPYVLKNVDIAFVSLTNDYLGACVPSKIYEYINFALPIIAALPKGDAFDIIKDNSFGFCTKYDDYEGIAGFIKELSNNRDLYNEIRNNILRKRDLWSMDVKIKELVKRIRGIL